MFFKNKEVFVPIGSSCSVASYLRYIGYRKEAFPFDWTVTPIQSAIELINNDFKDFFEEENLVYLESTNRLLFKENGVDVEVSKDIITPVYDKKYHILYVHDFSKNSKLEYEQVKQKYLKRVDRLKKTMKDESIKITFVYDNVNPNEWQKEQYEQTGYNFKLLDNNFTKNLNIQRNNINIVSLNNFKKQTYILRVLKSFIKKVGLTK